MADLIEYRQYKRNNRGYCYILIVIDYFSRLVYATPLQHKIAEDTSEAFKTILDNLLRFPIHSVIDKGKEFFNSKVQNFFASVGVNHYSIPTMSLSEASLVERVIRTIKSRLEKYFFATKSHR